MIKGTNEIQHGIVAKYAGREIKEVRDTEQCSMFEARDKVTIANLQNRLSQAETLTEVKVILSQFIALQTGYGY
jgi:hypothetical protein